MLASPGNCCFARFQIKGHHFSLFSMSFEFAQLHRICEREGLGCLESMNGEGEGFQLGMKGGEG